MAQFKYPRPLALSTKKRSYFSDDTVDGGTFPVTLLKPLLQKADCNTMNQPLPSSFAS